MTDPSALLVLVLVIGCGALLAVLFGGASEGGSPRPSRRPPPERPARPTRSAPARGAGPVAVYDGEVAGARTLRSRRFGLSAQPDRIVRRADGTLELIEYKSLARKVQEGHRVQAIAGAIAAIDSGFDVRAASVELADGTRTPVRFDLLADGRADVASLFARIRRHRDRALVALRGDPPPAFPAPGKCGKCGYRESCTYARAA